MYKFIIWLAVLFSAANLFAQQLVDGKLKYEKLQVPPKQYMKLNGKTVEIKRDPLVKRYSIGMANYTELAELINISLTKEGRATHISRMNSILVIDQIEAHNRIIDILNQTQEDAYNIHMEINYRNTRSLNQKGIIINTGPIVIKDWDIKKPDSVRIDGGVSKRTNDQNQKIKLTTMSGYPAKLWAVETSPYTEHLRSYKWINSRTRKPVIINEVWQNSVNVGTELYVRPKYRGKGIIEVELVPMLRFKKPGGGYDKFEVQTLNTKVTVYQGRPVNLGGVNSSTNKFFSSLFNPTGIAKGDSTNYLDFTLTAYVQKVGPPESTK